MTIISKKATRITNRSLTFRTYYIQKQTGIESDKNISQLIVLNNCPLRYRNNAFGNGK